MWRYLGLFLLAVSGVAHAAPSETPPVALDAAHSCVFPIAAISSGLRGETLLSFHVTAKGTVANAWVAEATGSDAEDRAAVACAASWRYKPATRDGVAVERAWADVVRWDMKLVPPAPISVRRSGAPRPSPGTTVYQSPVSTGPAHKCDEYYRTAPAASGEQDGTVTTDFRIAADGSVQDAAIVRSSGNPTVDAATLTCVGLWRYKPAMRDGKPVDSPWQANSRWSAPPPRAAVPAQAATPSLPRYDTAPYPIGWRSCATFYPSSATAGPDGPTILSVLISRKGTVESATVAKSSGNAEFDAAAVACNATWIYKPATRGWSSVEAMHNEDVRWDTSSLLYPDSRDCTKFTTARADFPGTLNGWSWVLFRVMPDGTVQDAALNWSSGNAGLDAAALQCVSGWHFDVARLHLPADGYPRILPVPWRSELAASK
jgi:TonB family protein